MLWIEQISTARIDFIDQEGTTAVIELLYAPGQLDSLFAALRAETAFQAVSDCQRWQVSLTANAIPQVETNPDPIGSNLLVGTVIFTTGVGTYGTIGVPGLRAALLQSSGCFAGYAVDLEHADIQALGEVAIGTVCTPRGDSFAALAGGGLRQQWSDIDRRSG